MKGLKRILGGAIQYGLDVKNRSYIKKASTVMIPNIHLGLTYSLGFFILDVLSEGFGKNISERKPRESKLQTDSLDIDKR